MYSIARIWFTNRLGTFGMSIHCDAGYFLTMMAGTKPHFICIDTEPILFDYFN